MSARNLLSPWSRHLPVALWLFLAAFAPVLCPAAERLDTTKLAQMDAAIHQAIAKKKLPGGVLWLEHKEAKYHHAFGQRAVLPKTEDMTEDTIFDAASLTKVLATTP